jgi:signal transduction histidine kinase
MAGLDVRTRHPMVIADLLTDPRLTLLASVHLVLEQAVIGLPPRLRERSHQVRGHLDVMESQIRRRSHALRPTILDDLGLLPALHVQEFPRTS